MYKLIIATLLLTVSTTDHAACNSSITRTAPDSRYELINGDAEVKDKYTDLIWQRCSLGQTWNGTSCTGNAATYKWASALQVATNMGSGWRVPNVKELDSIIEQACYSPSINEVFFPNTVSSYYWSSSTVASSSLSAWFVYFSNGKNYAIIRAYKGSNNYVRLVRSSQ